MSSMGTSVAAGVAQTALQAQQVARQRDRRVTQRREEAQRVREMFEAAMRALEEGDRPGSAPHVDISDQLPDTPTPFYQPPEDEPRDQAELAAAQPDSPATESSTTSSEVTRPDARLYRHLDVQA